MAAKHVAVSRYVHARYGCQMIDRFLYWGDHEDQKSRKIKLSKIAFGSLRNKFQWEFFDGCHRLTSLVSVRQNQPIVYVFIVPLTDHCQ